MEAHLSTHAEPRAFLIMVNSDACPSGIGAPARGSQWENGSFQTGLPRRTKNLVGRSTSETMHPNPGDKAIIWVNELQGGKGLTAHGSIASYDRMARACRVSGVQLFREPLVDNRYLTSHVERSETFRDIRSSTVVRLRLLSTSQWDELLSAALSRQPPPADRSIDYHLRWREGGAKDCTDILPVEWFERVGEYRHRIHDVELPRGQIRRAKCDLIVTDLAADLNYRAHAAYNDKHGMQLGVMRIHFMNSARNEIAFVEWADDDRGKFTICDIEVDSELTALAEDITAIKNDCSLDKTTCEQLIQARRGQGRFRFKLIKKWGRRCSVSGISTLEALRASHIKPWRQSTNDERLDPENGFLLTATLDALFDRYLISFTHAGEMVISSRIPASERTLLGIPASLRIVPGTRQNRFLNAHRTEFEKRSRP
jgi:hypothetical protein